MPLVDPGLHPLLDVELERLRLGHRQHLPLRQLRVLNSCEKKKINTNDDNQKTLPFSKTIPPVGTGTQKALTS